MGRGNSPARLLHAVHVHRGVQNARARCTSGGRVLSSGNRTRRLIGGRMCRVMSPGRQRAARLMSVSQAPAGLPQGSRLGWMAITIDWRRPLPCTSVARSLAGSFVAVLLLLLLLVLKRQQATTRKDMLAQCPNSLRACQRGLVMTLHAVVGQACLQTMLLP